jgi:TolB protein
MSRKFHGVAASILALLFLSPSRAQQVADFPAAKTGGNYMHNYYLPPPSSTPFWPAWSPSGEEIAFSMQGSIWKIRLGDTTAYELTSAATYDSSPAWSPDGKWIVYTAEEDSQNINLRILNLSTGETRALTTGRDLNLDPVWAPDGTQIAYVSTLDEGWFNIFVLPIVDGKAGRATQLTRARDFGKERLYFGRMDLQIEPTWSPDGKEIIFLSNHGIPLGSGALWRMPAEPGGMERAKMIRREETLYRTRPDWSPDGTRIIYSSHLGSQFNNLFVLPSSGGEPYQMTFGDWDHFQPRWSPDGRRIAYVSNQHGVTDLRILDAVGGREETVDIAEKRYRRPMGWLEVRVKDAETGQTTAARIEGMASDGKMYTPDDAYHRVGRTDEHLFHTQGTFVLQVPVGRVKINAVKGFEYWTASSEVEIRPHEVTPLELSLARMDHMASKGWYSGSTHVHMNYGGTLHNTPENLMMMAAAEDVQVIGELICNKDNRIFDYQFFRGALDPHSTKECLLYFNEEYRPPWYGHIGLLNLTDHLISPFTTGYEGTAIESLYPSNTDILRLAHAQGAIGGYVHPYHNDPAQSQYAGARGFPVDVALGTVDYLELVSNSDHLATSQVWHRILNCGFRVPITGGEDSISNLFRIPVVGADRTYAHLGPALDWKRWIEAIRQGHTFATNGPLLEFSIDGKEEGEEIHLSGQGGHITIHARMESIAPVEKVEVLSNCRVMETLPLRGDGKSAELTKEVEVSGSAWFTLRAYGAHPVTPVDDFDPFAETSPIYVDCGGRPIRSSEDARYFITWIQAISKMAAADPGWRSESEKSHVLDQFQTAQKVFEQRAVK